MNRRPRTGIGDTVILTLLALLCVVAAVQLVISARIASRPGATCPPVVAPRTLPCQAIPMTFIEREPRCANELLRAMNVTNVHVLTEDEAVAHITGIYEQARALREMLQKARRKNETCTS